MLGKSIRYPLNIGRWQSNQNKVIVEISTDYRHTFCCVSERRSDDFMATPATIVRVKLDRQRLWKSRLTVEWWIYSYSRMILLGDLHTVLRVLGKRLSRPWSKISCKKVVTLQKNQYCHLITLISVCRIIKRLKQVFLDHPKDSITKLWMVPTSTKSFSVLRDYFAPNPRRIDKDI